MDEDESGTGVSAGAAVSGACADAAVVSGVSADAAVVSEVCADAAVVAEGTNSPVSADAAVSGACADAAVVSGVRADAAAVAEGTDSPVSGACADVVVSAGGTDSPVSADAAVSAVWRIEAPRLIAGLARVLGGDLGLAEDLAQDALVAALEQWPTEGVPRNPGAWLMTVAKRRTVDLIRRDQTYAKKLELIGRDLETSPSAAAPGPESVLDEPDIEDDLLRLVFTACHPVLPAPSRVALTLKLLGGLSTPEIARAYLVPEPTIAQRIVRAKRSLAEKKIPFEVPAAEELSNRLASVLEVIYLIFNEGYAATAGEDWTRPALCDEAVRLARVLSALMPKEPEVHGLAALLEIQSSRLASRTTSDGGVVLLGDQDRTRWNQLFIRRGFAALAIAENLSAAAARPPGPYALQAAIAASHARAMTPEETDWPTIASLYDALAAQVPTPVVALNRAVAVAMADGPAAGLALVDQLVAADALPAYHLLPAVRADLLSRLDRHAEAHADFERAARLATNAAERALLEQRAAEAQAKTTHSARKEPPR